MSTPTSTEYKSTETGGRSRVAPVRFSAAETAEPVWPTRELAGRPASRSPFTPPAFAGRAEKK